MDQPLVKLLTFLQEPLPPEEVGFKVAKVSKKSRRGLVVAYADARSIQDRLDEAIKRGLLRDWSVTWSVVETQCGDKNAGYTVEATLRLILPDDQVSQRTDVGEGDSLKAAYSDAFKRAAVHFGIARYLYRLDKVWVPLGENDAIPPDQLKRLRAMLPRPSAGGKAQAVSNEGPGLKERLREGDAKIAALVERLKAKGRARDAVNVLLRHGYHLGDPGTTAEDLERARRVYQELKALEDKGTSRPEAVGAVGGRT